MSSATYGKAVSVMSGTASLAIAGWTYHTGDWSGATLIISIGCLLSAVAFKYAMIATRTICPMCRANVQKDFMAVVAVGKSEECKACAGEASSYPWWTRHAKPSGLITSGIKRSCGRCACVRYQVFMEKAMLTQPEIGRFEAWVCRPRFAKACARNAQVASLPFERRRWYWRWLTLRRDAREYWLDMTFSSQKDRPTMTTEYLCTEPNCKEVPAGTGADGKLYCNGHMHKGGGKEIVIT